MANWNEHGLLPEQIIANARMNEILKQEQKPRPLPQGTNPVPDYTGGRSMIGMSGGIAAAVPENLQNQYGGYYATNVLSPQNKGLLSQMGVSPELIKQAVQTQQIQPNDLATKQKAAWDDLQSYISVGKISVEEGIKAYENLFGKDALDNMRGTQKKYEPKTQEEALDFERKKLEQELGYAGEKERQKTMGQEKAKFEANYPKIQGTMSALNKQWDLVDETIDNALNMITPFTAGAGAWARILPATPQRTLAGYLETVKANIGFDKLQQMRADSPTGGALGQVSDFENRLLQAVKGSLDQNLSPSVLKKNIERIKLDLQNIRNDRNSAFKKDYNSFIGKQQESQTSTQMQKLPEGAKQAPDGKFYIPDPQRAGKYLLVEE